MEAQATLSKKNQITVPKSIRAILNLQSCDTIVFRSNGVEVMIERADFSYIPSTVKSIFHVLRDLNCPILIDLEHEQTKLTFHNELLSIFNGYSIVYCSTAEQLEQLEPNTIVIWTGIAAIPKCNKQVLVYGTLQDQSLLFQEYSAYYLLNGDQYHINRVSRISHQSNTIIYTNSENEQ